MKSVEKFYGTRVKKWYPNKIQVQGCFILGKHTPMACVNKYLMYVFINRMYHSCLSILACFAEKKPFSIIFKHLIFRNLGIMYCRRSFNNYSYEKIVCVIFTNHLQLSKSTSSTLTYLLRYLLILMQELLLWIYVLWLLSIFVEE